MVNGILILNPSTLLSGKLNTDYNALITASGGTGSYTFRVISGTLPGLTLNPDGRLSGKPATSGSYSFEIEAIDTNFSNTKGTQAYTITVFPFAYVTNYLSNRVSSCTLNSSGVLITCTSLPNAFFGPHGIVLNSVNSLVYVTNTSGNNVSICSIKLDGTLDTCTLAGSPFNYPTGIELNSDSDKPRAYVSNYLGTGVSVCPVNTDGSLGTCAPQSNPDDTFLGPGGIELNTTNTRAYVSNHGNGTVSFCSINSDGTLGTCAASNIGDFSGPQGIVLNAANTLLYVANVFDNTISICFVQDGPLDSCIIFNPGNLSQPADIALG